jgi:hypothetical protein
VYTTPPREGKLNRSLIGDKFPALKGQGNQSYSGLQIGEIRASATLSPRALSVAEGLSLIRKNTAILQTSLQKTIMELNYNSYLSFLEPDDVLELFEDHQLVKAKDIKHALNDSFGEPIQKRLVEHLSYRGIKTKGKQSVWLQEGVDCRILRSGAIGWQKGRLKVKVSVEFIPDEPESPLDDIRRDMDKYQ